MRLSAFIGSHRMVLRLLVASLMLLALMTATVGFLAWSLGARDEIVVLVPPKLGHETRIAEAQADADYKRSWALFVAQQLGSVTPANAKFLRPTLGPLLSAGIYTDVMVRLESELEKVRRDRLTLWFEPREVIFEEPRNRVFVHGLAVTRTLVGAESRDPVTYEMQIAIENFRPRIDFLNTYRGKPRTAEVLTRLAEEGDAQ